MVTVKQKGKHSRIFLNVFLHLTNKSRSKESIYKCPETTDMSYVPSDAGPLTHH